jgi:Protein of unknown function (DUF3800)
VKYYLFLDESGDHGLGKVDPSFPVFVLCGIICPEEEYGLINENMNEIKESLWKTRNVIFHSRDIRKCEKEFQILFDQNIKKDFYDRINRLITNSKYRIIASAINKNKYIKRYGRLNNDVYEIALSFIIERSVFLLDGLRGMDKTMEVIIEKRGSLEDKKLSQHFQQVLMRGTGFIDPKRLRNYNISFSFEAKKDNLNGLQLSDLIAYPIARYVIDPKRANPAFDVLSERFYKKGNKRYGLKIFP